MNIKYYVNRNKSVIFARPVTSFLALLKKNRYPLFFDRNKSYIFASQKIKNIVTV